MQRFNEAMSEVRVSVEWMFGTITNYYKFVDFKKQLKIGVSPVGKIYLVCGILQNAHTCLYENLASHVSTGQNSGNRKIQGFV